MVFDSRKRIIQSLVDAYKWHLNYWGDGVGIAEQYFLEQLGMSKKRWMRCLANSPDLKLAFDSI